MAVNPPITIGELTNVPAPGSAISSAWSQDVTRRTTMRFGTLAELAAYVPPGPGFLGLVVEAPGIMSWWLYNGSKWCRWSPQFFRVDGIAQACQAGTVLMQGTVPPDEGSRVVNARAVFTLDTHHPGSGAAPTAGQWRFSIRLNNVIVGQAIVDWQSPRYMPIVVEMLTVQLPATEAHVTVLSDENANSSFGATATGYAQLFISTFPVQAGG